MHQNKLARFMARNGITVAALADETGKSVRHIYYLRRGTTPHLISAINIARACSALTSRRVRLEDLFDLESKLLEKAS